MSVENIDTSVFMLPSSRASQSGNGLARQMTLANKINEIIAALGALATTSSFEAFNSALDDLSQSVLALQFQIADAIPDVSATGVNVSVLNLATLQAINTQVANQATVINKILAVMRTRKEIKS